MKKINVNWAKISENPEAKQKIVGKSLLLLRDKINDLEKQLSLKKKQLEALEILFSKHKTLNKDVSTEAESKLKEKEIKIDALLDKLEFLEQTITNREKEIKVIRKDLKQRNKQFEFDKKFSEQAISDKKKENDELRVELQEKSNQIEAEIKNLKYTILNKDLEIEKLETGFNEKIEEINKLKKKISLFVKIYTQMKHERKYSRIIKRISRLMLLKGFLSEKEFEQLLGKIEKKTNVITA